MIYRADVVFIWWALFIGIHEQTHWRVKSEPTANIHNVSMSSADIIINQTELDKDSTSDSFITDQTKVGKDSTSNIVIINQTRLDKDSAPHGHIYEYTERDKITMSYAVIPRQTDKQVDKKDKATNSADDVLLKWREFDEFHSSDTGELKNTEFDQVNLFYNANTSWPDALKDIDLHKANMSHFHSKNSTALLPLPYIQSTTSPELDHLNSMYLDVTKEPVINKVGTPLLNTPKDTGPQTDSTSYLDVPKITVVGTEIYNPTSIILDKTLSLSHSDLFSTLNISPTLVNAGETLANTENALANAGEVLSNTDETQTSTGETLANTDKTLVNTSEALANTGETLLSTGEKLTDRPDVSDSSTSSTIGGATLVTKTAAKKTSSATTSMNLLLPVGNTVNMTNAQAGNHTDRNSELSTHSLTEKDPDVSSVFTGAIKEPEPGLFHIDVSACNYSRTEGLTASHGTVKLVTNSRNSSKIFFCSWVLTEMRGHFLTILFEKFQLGTRSLCGEYYQDVIEIVDDQRWGAGNSLVRPCDQGLPIIAFSLQSNLFFRFRLTLLESSEFPEIKFHFNSTPESQRRNLQVTNISATLGYVMSPGYNGQREYANFMNASYMLKIPENHVVMVSFPRFDLEDHRTCYFDYLSLLTVDANNHSETEVWRKCGAQSIPAMIYRTSLRLRFVSDSVYSNSGFKMLYTFHPVTQIPRAVGMGLFNCSDSTYSSFADHLKCNLEPECQNGEDESSCPYNKRGCGPAAMFIRGMCYTYVKYTTNISWNDAYSQCRLRGQTLVSLNVPEKWQMLHEFLNFGKRSATVYVGLRTSQSSLATMYREVLQWSDQTMAFYINVIGKSVSIPSCAYIRPGASDVLTVGNCDLARLANFICESEPNTSLGDVVELPSFRLNTTNLWPRNISVYLCPSKHLTHDFLSCDPDSHCEAEQYVSSCETPNAGIVPLFECDDNSQTLPYTLVCDFRSDCVDGSDERNCVHTKCIDGFQCRNLQCIPFNTRCDGMQHCVDRSDEECPLSISRIVPSLEPPAMVNLDGYGTYTQYPLEAFDSCPDTHFRCPDSYCLPVYLRCNGLDDCPGREDEVGCENLKCVGFYHCRGSQVCLHPDQVCDGVFQCPQQDDESWCGLVCPPNCRCQGLAFICATPFPAILFPNMRYLDVSGSNMTLQDVESNSYLVRLHFSSCNLKTILNITLPNLRILDLSDNNINAISMTSFMGLRNLRQLIMSGNPLTVLLKADSSVKRMQLKSINLSGTKLEIYNGTFLGNFPKIRILNLSESTLNTISDYAFDSTPELEILDMRGSPVSSFPVDMLKRLSHLVAVYANNYKVCCAATLPDNFDMTECYTQRDEISSCEDLLEVDLYRVAVWILASLAIVGNIGTFVARFCLQSHASQASFNVFVMNLCVADFIMGIYLAMIGTADQMYRGKYLWYDSQWKKSMACHVAGFLSLLSCEVSAFIICLITLDRILILRFPFSRCHFKIWSAFVACAVAWILGIVLAAIPLMPMTSGWEFYSQTGICIPLPITRKSFSGHVYSFGVLILLNFVLFLLIAIGQVFIYCSVRTNSMVKNMRKTSRDTAVARRLFIIVFTDFLCWFPIGLLGLMASSGIRISSEVNVGIAIFVLPLNSALNPFLYTFNMIIERRRRSKESRMLARLETRFFSEVSRQDAEMVPQRAVSKETALSQIATWLDYNVLTSDDVISLNSMNSNITCISSENLQAFDGFAGSKAADMLRAWLANGLITPEQVIAIIRE